MSEEHTKVKKAARVLSTLSGIGTAVASCLVWDEEGFRAIKLGELRLYDRERRRARIERRRARKEERDP